MTPLQIVGVFLASCLGAMAPGLIAIFWGEIRQPKGRHRA